MGLKDVKVRRPFIVSSPRLARMYILIKVHKEGHPGRPVVSQIDDPSYKLCRELTRILSPMSLESLSYIKNAFDLKKELAKIQVKDSYRMASFDVVNLYPSIPLKKAFEIIEDRLHRDESLAGRTEWKVNEIMKLLGICMETHFKTLDGNIWTQIDGCPIGKSISGEIAEIFMNWFEEQYIFSKNKVFKPILWKRMRDDVFVIWDTNSGINMQDNEMTNIEQFLPVLNSFEEKIQFTLEMEKDKCLPFLDMVLIREEERILTKVYRKPTHTQRYINWRSYHPKNVIP
jgi:hypothetical protein